MKARILYVAVCEEEVEIDDKFIRLTNPNISEEEAEDLDEQLRITISEKGVDNDGFLHFCSVSTPKDDVNIVLCEW